MADDDNDRERTFIEDVARIIGTVPVPARHYGAR
jgi:hypothetical protein